MNIKVRLILQIMKNNDLKTVIRLLFQNKFSASRARAYETIHMPSLATTIKIYNHTLRMSHLILLNK